MASVKLIIVLGLFAVAMGFSLPEYENNDLRNYSEFAFVDELPLEENRILIRNARSPQGRIGGGVELSSQRGTSATLNYNHQIGKNFEAYGETARNFRRNDNSGTVGLRYRF